VGGKCDSETGSGHRTRKALSRIARFVRKDVYPTVDVPEFNCGSYRIIIVYSGCRPIGREWAGRGSGDDEWITTGIRVRVLSETF
jgi:hypothetical protein